MPRRRAKGSPLAQGGIRTLGSGGEPLQGPSLPPLLPHSASGWVTAMSCPGPRGAVFVILHLSSSSFPLTVHPAFVRHGICLEQWFSFGDAAPRRHSGSVWRLRAGGGSAPRARGCCSAPHSAQDRASAVPRLGSPRLRQPWAESSKHENGHSFRQVGREESTFRQGDGHLVPCGAWGWVGATHKLGQVRQNLNHARLASETWPQTEGDPRAGNQPDASGHHSATQNVN